MTLRANLPLAVAGKVAADACRRLFPAAESEPWRPGAPVSWSGDTMRIEYGGVDGWDGYAADHRLAWAVDRMPAFAAGGGAIATADLVLPPQPLAVTGLRAGARRRAVVEVTAVAGGGAQVWVWTTSAAVTGRLADALARDLALVETVVDNAAALASGHPQRALQAADRELARRQRPGAAETLDRWVSLLHMQGGLAAARMQPVQVRRAVCGLRSALDGWPELREARSTLTRLTAAAGDREGGWAERRDLAALPGGGGGGVIAAAPSMVRPAHEARDWFADASELLGRGELEAARHHLVRGYVADGAGSEARALGLLARVARAHGQDRRAADLRLAQVLLAGEGPDAVLAMSEDLAAAGDARGSLRWLLRHWDQLSVLRPERARAALAAARQRLDAGDAARVMATMGQLALAEDLIEGWSDPAGRALLAELARASRAATDALSQPATLSVPEPSLAAPSR